MSFLKNFIRRINQVITKVLDSPYQTRTRSGHQVSTPNPSTALTLPSFSSRPGTPILIDCRSEGSLTVDNYACQWTSKDIRSGCRSMSFGQYHRTTVSVDC